MEKGLRDLGPFTRCIAVVDVIHTLIVVLIVLYYDTSPGDG